MTRTDTERRRRENAATGGVPMPPVENFAEAFQPVMQLSQKVQSEFMTLWGHRSRAWTQWPATMLGCSTAQELAQAQTDYMKEMQEQYTSYFDRVWKETLNEQSEMAETMTRQVEQEAQRARDGRTHREAA